VLVAENFSYCTVPNSGQDALLFGSVAVLVTVVLQGKLSAVWVLIAGARPLSAFTGHYTVLESTVRGRDVSVAGISSRERSRACCARIDSVFTTL